MAAGSARWHNMSAIPVSEVVSSPAWIPSGSGSGSTPNGAINGHSNGATASGKQDDAKSGKRVVSFATKAGLAQMLKGGVIMDVTNADEARIAEEAGAVAVMALERVPSDIRKQGGVARMTDPKVIKEIRAAVTIPVMAKARIGHFVEAQILQALKIDFIDESEVLTPADDVYHINKHEFSAPFVCGCRNLGEALRRIQEGAAFIRTKGEAGTGNIVEAVRHAREVNSAIARLTSMDRNELYNYAKEIGAPFELVKTTAELGRLPVVQFAAGGIATPADAALMMQLGMDGVFVGSGIFKSSNPKKMAAAIVQAVTHFNDPEKLAQVSEALGDAMKGIEIDPKKMELFSLREK
jgi:pyridoxal 5'-phosphate synthase pdxS subunit